MIKGRLKRNTSSFPQLLLASNLPVHFALREIRPVEVKKNNKNTRLLFFRACFSQLQSCIDEVHRLILLLTKIWETIY